MIVSEPRQKQLLKMEWGTSEGLGFAGKGSQIGANGVVDPLCECRIDGTCEAKFAQAFLDFGKKADHGNGFDTGNLAAETNFANLSV